MHQGFGNRSVRWVLGCLVALSAVAAASSARAATTIHVNSGCSLAQAIDSLNSLARPPGSTCEIGTGTGDTIQLQAATYNVAQQLNIYRSVTFKGAGPSATTLAATSAFVGTELLHLENGVGSGTVAITLQDLKLDGSALSSQVSGVYSPPSANLVSLNLYRARVTGFTWAGIYVVDADLVVTDSDVSSNSSPENGGGIHIEQTSSAATNVGFQVQRSTISGNSGYDGGGLYSSVSGNCNLDQSTVSENYASNSGGGLVSNNEFYLHLHNSTVAFNGASSFGGGFAAISTNAFNFFDSIIASNWPDDGYTPPAQTVLVQNTLIGNTSGFSGNYFYDGADLRNVDPLLDALHYDLGGSSHLLVHRIYPGSPAMDYLSGSTLPDQRNFPAPRDGDGNGTFLHDLGAYEYDPNWQTEMLLLAGKSSDAHVIASTAGGDTSTTYSAAQGTNLQANAANDFVTYAVPIADVGSYGVKVRVRRGTNRGKFQLAVSTNPTGPWTSVGAVQDLYSSTSTFTELNLTPGTSASLGASTVYFRFLVTGKNASSSGYQLFLDYIRLTLI